MMAPETNGTSSGTGQITYHSLWSAVEATATALREIFDEFSIAVDDLALAFSMLGLDIQDAIADGLEGVLPRPSGGRIQPWRQPSRRPEVYPVMGIDAVRAGRRMLYPRARRV